MFKRLKNRKGFSIVEVVIAMVVVSIVTITAISISSMASDNSRKAMYNLDAQYFAADVIECYKASGNALAIPINAIEFRNGDGYTSDGTSLIFTLPKSGYKAYVKIANPQGSNTISVEVKDAADNIIASASYTRGG